MPSFGDRKAKIVILGLAPAAHGANRTGRMFTGDRSGDFLFQGLYRAGFANQPTSCSADDGLVLTGVYITAAVRCAPPANHPAPDHLHNCSRYLASELEILHPNVVVCLGAIAWDAALRSLQNIGFGIPKPRPRFAHGRECSIGSSVLLGCYHVSQQNTFTGRLTGAMLDQVLDRAKTIAKPQGPA